VEFEEANSTEQKIILRVVNHWIVSTVNWVSQDNENLIVGINAELSILKELNQATSLGCETCIVELPEMENYTIRNVINLNKGTVKEIQLQPKDKGESLLLTVQWVK